ncbi:hypothetical protein CVT26_015959 [Gymnopilus dilepis]|uniref:Uncharacterized protein n=1 Tax=Gymnopilus dilepis TaxID=231916 RepID=A0A409WAD4_9AGAR|nr:hypothetical protein CVT26_015959 [Gymnopilus dilepis]
MILPRPVLHDFSDPSTWPPEIQGFLSESESESQKSPVSSPETGSPPFYPVLQPVTSSIQELKHLSTAIITRNPSFTGYLECLQTSLIASVALSSSLKEPVLLSDVSFILPRVSDDPANAARSGRAILMVGAGFRVRGPEKLAPGNGQCQPPSVELASRREERNVGPSPAKVSNGNNSSNREEPIEAIEAPFDAHILPGRGRRTSCFIPAICVADKPNIKAPSFLPSRDERTSTAPLTRKSHYSASEFAALPPPKPRLILPRSDVWLWTHGALGVACCRLSEETKWQFEIFSYEPDDLNRMVDLYESHVKKPCWPPHWRELDDLPSTNGIHAHSRELLFKEYRARSINDKARISASGDLGTEISGDVLSVLFQATELAACLAKQHARMNDISDTNHHLPWCLLLYKLTSNQPGSRAFLHNGPTYILRSPSLADDHDSIGLSRAQLWCYLIFYQLTGTSDSDCTPSEMTRLEDRSLYVNELARPFPNFPRHKLGSPDSVQKGDILGGIAKADRAICAIVQPIQGSEVISTIIHSTFVDPPRIEGSEIGLPYCHVKYKRDSEDEDIAYEHLKEACISTVHLLSLLGILDFPVFGLLTSGGKGTVILTWKSIEQTPSQPGSGCVFVMDHLVHTFDISKSFETLQFIFTLYRIFKFGEKLQELLHDRDLSSCSEIFGAGMGSS